MHYQLYNNYIQRINQYAEQYPELKSLSLEQIATEYTTHIGEVAAQAVNHPFFFQGLSSSSPGQPNGPLYQTLSKQFGSYQTFVDQFTKEAKDLFGSGWVWLVYDTTMGMLRIVPGNDSYSPVVDGNIPLLCLDVWEHAYYSDYGPDRDQYIDAFWKYINWARVEQIYAKHVYGYQVRVDLPGPNPRNSELV